MGVSENRGTPKSSILIWLSSIHHPFWGIHIFWKHPYKPPTIGHLNKSHVQLLALACQLFYLASRGLDAANARRRRRCVVNDNLLKAENVPRACKIKKDGYFSYIWHVCVKMIHELYILPWFVLSWFTCDIKYLHIHKSIGISSSKLQEAHSFGATWTKLNNVKCYAPSTDSRPRCWRRFAVSVHFLSLHHCLPTSMSWQNQRAAVASARPPYTCCSRTSHPTARRPRDAPITWGWFII